MPYAGNRAALWVCPTGGGRKHPNFAVIDAMRDGWDPTFESYMFVVQNIGLNAEDRPDPDVDFRSRPVKLSQILRPPVLIYAADSTGRLPDLYDPYNPTGGSYMTPRYVHPQSSYGLYTRHSNGANILFCDWHVAWHSAAEIDAWDTTAEGFWHFYNVP